MIDFHGVILPDDVAARLADVTQQMHAAATDPNAPNVRVLLCGAPGVGKTMVMRALAEDARFKAIPVSAMNVRAPYIGQTSHLFRQLFERARASAPAVLLFDAFEHIFPRRDGHRSDSVSEEGVSELLMELSGADRRGRGPAVCIVGEVVDLDQVDPAVLSRIPLRIQLPLPDDECRKEILRRAVREYNVSLGANAEQTLDEWNEQLRGSSGRAIVTFAREADERRGSADRLRADAATPLELDDRTAEPLDALGLDEALLTKLRQSTRLLSKRDEVVPLGFQMPAAYLLVGDAGVARRVARAFAAEANMPLRHVTGWSAAKAEAAHPGYLQSRLQACVDAGPCLVLITDALHLVSARGSSLFGESQLMVRTWTAVALHLDAQRQGATCVPLLLNTPNVDALDGAIRRRMVYTFELPSAAGV